MSFKRTCPICGDEFWHPHHMNYNRQNLTCEKDSCKTAQKTKRQKERRFERRQARLVEAARRVAKAKKPTSGKVKVVISRPETPVRPVRVRKIANSLRARLNRLARKRWAKARKKGGSKWKK